MKRTIIALLLCLIIAIPTGCSNNGGSTGFESSQPGISEPSDTSGDASAPTDAESTPTSTEAPTATPTPEPTPTPVPDNSPKVALMLPDKYRTPVKENGGTIEKITYMAKDYLGDGPDVEKKAFVYLPYGYDESKQYNVLYLCHGIGGSENEWGMNNANSSIVKRILDNLFADGNIEPFIVVTPNGRAMALSGVTGNDLFYKWGYELRNDLIPYMESHYSTYAEYDENGYDMTATRTHRAIAGLSMGGMQTINIGICECLDLFSWFGAFSAAPTSYAAARISTAVSTSEYSVDFFYNICGLQDKTAYASASAAAKNLANLSEDFTADVNFMWQEKAGGHDFNIWYLGLYNFAQIAFGNEWKYAE